MKSARQAAIHLELYRPLLRRNWRCHLIMEREPDDAAWLRDLRAAGVEIQCQPRARGNFDWGNIARTRMLCRELRCDVFHCENIHNSPLLGAFLAGVKVRLWTKHALDFQEEGVREPAWREKIGLATRLSGRLATRVFAVSNVVRDELLNYGIPGDRVLVRHNPRRGIARREVGRAGARAELGYVESDVVFVTIGRAWPVKGWDILLRAFAPLARSDRRVRLLLVGGTGGDAAQVEFFGRLKSFIEMENLGAQVSFAGHVGDVGRMLAAGDVFVLPSRSEGFCEALVEALEAGLPCVSSRVGVAEEVIQEGVNGFLVNCNDELGLARALRQVAEDDELRARLARNVSVPPGIPTLADYAEQSALDYEAVLQAKGRWPLPA